LGKKPITTKKSTHPKKDSTQIKKEEENNSKTPAKRGITTKGSTSKKKSTSPKKRIVETKEKLNSLKILKNSPYLKQSTSIQKNKKELTLKELFENNLVDQREDKMEIILTGQYQKAIELIMETDAANLTPILVGPPGVGKTTLCRYYAQIRAEITGNNSFEWLTFDESTKPAHLVGSFNPAITIQKGFSFEAFNPGPLTKAMLRGGVFLGNEINRATEYTQNSLLEPLEERMISIPHIGRIKASSGFFFIGAMNPSELVGTHRLGEALKDRFNVWIELDYPKKQTEIKIIKHNNPYFKIEEGLLEKIYLLVNRTRTHRQIQIPASLRSGITMARLTGINISKNQKINSSKILREVAHHVLAGAIQPKPGIKAKDIVKSIITQVIGTT